MSKNKYDDMPLCYITDPKECGIQIAKRKAKEIIADLSLCSENYSVSMDFILEEFRKEINKEIQNERKKSCC